MAQAVVAQAATSGPDEATKRRMSALESELLAATERERFVFASVFASVFVHNACDLCLDWPFRTR